MMLRERHTGGPHALEAVIVQLRQQPVHHLAAALPGLPPGKAPGHPPQQVRQQRGPGLIGYRGSSDCRVLVVSHQPIMIAAAAPLRGHLTCASNPTVTNYSCRISEGFQSLRIIPLPWPLIEVHPQSRTISSSSPGRV